MDPRALSFRLTRTAVRLICHRNRGVGSDGILTIERTRRAQFGMRIFNPDGSEAEKSGNGVRIFAKCLWDHGYTHRRAFDVETRGGTVSVTLHLRGRRVRTLTAGMGRATFRTRAIPTTGPGRGVADEGAAVGPRRIRVTAVPVGNA